MTELTPILANERNAAKLLDLTVREFRSLVEEGHLPRPRDLAGLKRWDVEELRRICRGEAASGMKGVQW